MLQHCKPHGFYRCNRRSRPDGYTAVLPGQLCSYIDEQRLNLTDASQLGTSMMSQHGCNLYGTITESPLLISDQCETVLLTLAKNLGVAG